MSLSSIVKFNISKTAPPINQPGFGIMLALTIGSGTWGPERTRTYYNLAGVAADYATTTPEYILAEQYFGQEYAPTAMILGRLANLPTKVVVVGVPSVSANTTYSFGFFANGVLQQVSYTSPSSGMTNDTIITGLQTAYAALSGTNATSSVTGSTGSHTLTLTGSAAGNWFAVEPNDLNLISVQETTTDPGTAADLAAIQAENNSWYGLATIFKGQSIPLACAAFAEANTKLFILADSDTAIPTVAYTSASDVFHALVGLSRARTGVFYHPRDYQFGDVSEMGRWFPLTPGSDNWLYKALSGLTPGIGPTFKSYTATHVTNMTAKRANYYDQLVIGNPIVQGQGMVTDKEYIDIIRGLDAFTADGSTRIAQVTEDAEKIPETDDGIAMIRNCLEAAVKKGVRDGIIAPSAPVPSVFVPSIDDVDSTDLENRNLPLVSATFRCAGAFNTFVVTANVTE